MPGIEYIGRKSGMDYSIIDKAANSAVNAVNYVSETLQGKSAEGSKEADKEQAKKNIAGNDSLTDRISGVTGAIPDKLEQSKHESAASAKDEGLVRLPSMTWSRRWWPVAGIS